MLAATITALRTLDRPEAPASRRLGLAQAPQDDAELVERVRSGSEWAAEALYRRYLQPVWAMVLPLLGSAAEAEDVVQDAFIVALKNIDNLRDTTRFGPWLKRIAVSLVHRRYRQRKTRQTLGISWGIEDASLDALCTTDCPPEVRTELGKMAKVLAAIPGRYRIAWMLRYVEGCSLDEIAEHTGASVATVKRRIKAAADRLRKHVSPKGGAV